MINIDVYIIDDNFSHSSKIKKFIQEYSEKNSSIRFQPYEITNYIQFYKEFNKERFTAPTLFLIDIYLNTFFTGIELAKKISDQVPNASIIFMTFDDKKSIQVVNSQIYPLGYIVKQIKIDHFFKNDLFRLMGLFASNLQNQIEQHALLSVRYGNENILVNRAKILYISTIKGWRGKLAVITTYGEFIINGKLGDLKEQLGSHFFSKSKSYIINILQIEALSRVEGLVKFYNGADLYLGVRGIDKLNEYLKGGLIIDE